MSVGIVAAFFAAGVAIGIAAGIRLAAVLLARLDPAERLAFARRVNHRARRRM